MSEQTDLNRLADSVHVVSVFAYLTVGAIESMPAEVRRGVYEAIIEVLQQQVRPYA